ncbi:MAG TPA: hypothetical protein VFZ38_07610, partial [Vicinamibacterales bacterium]
GEPDARDFRVSTYGTLEVSRPLGPRNIRSQHELSLRMPRKNSLVANINRRKRKGTSRPKSRSTVSKKSYRDMQRGWPARKRRKKAVRKTR